MALSRLYQFLANTTAVGSQVRGEFDNIYDNALSLISPLTANLNANLKQLTNLLFETQAASQSAATEGRVYYQTTEDQVHVDDGTNIRRVPTIASPARGGLVRVSSTANVFSQLAVGAANTILTSDGTDPAWSGTPTIATEDARTNTVARPVTIQATTSGSPAAEIGTGILLNAESGDENPSNVVALDGVFTDVTAGSEDSVLSVKLRVAGGALDEKYRLASTAGSGFTATVTHANTADRTYTLPNETGTVSLGITAQNVVTGSRALATDYQNTSGKAMFVTVSVAETGGAAAASNFEALTDSATTPTTVVASEDCADETGHAFSFWVLSNNYYRVVEASGGGTPVIRYWVEWT